MTQKEIDLHHFKRDLRGVIEDMKIYVQDCRTRGRPLVMETPPHSCVGCWHRGARGKDHGWCANYHSKNYKIQCSAVNWCNDRESSDDL